MYTHIPIKNKKMKTLALSLSFSLISLSFYDLLAAPKNKDHVSSPSSLAPRLLSEFFQKAMYDNSHPALLGASLYYVPAPIHMVILGIFLSPRAFIQGEKYYTTNRTSPCSVLRSTKSQIQYMG